MADLVHAGSDAPVTGQAPSVQVDLQRRQIEVDVPHQDWNPGQSTVRMAMGVGLWNASTNSYLLPQSHGQRHATRWGRARGAARGVLQRRVPHGRAEPVGDCRNRSDYDAAWWRDAEQGTALANGDISPLYASVNFAKLAAGVTDNSGVPTTGPMDRILASHFEPAQGANFSSECGLQGAEEPSTCVPEYQGNLQPFAVYIPPGRQPAGGYGLTLLLHSLSANYNQYLGSRNQSEFGDRLNPSIVITPEARGPDQEYEGLGAADVFEAWAEIACLYPLNPAYTDITGYSMGGIGTFKLGSQFPDLFARAQPTVGFETNNDVLASMRNLPVLMWNASADELVNASDYGQTAEKLSSLGYRYEADVFQPCANSLCSPVLPNHLMLAVNDQFAPAAAFLGSATVDPNPAHVTYVVDTARDRPSYGIVGDHAYWVSGVTIRSASHTSTNGDPEGQIDVFSHGFGTGDPIASGSQPGTGTLTGGNMGPLAYASLRQTWTPPTPAPASDTLDITATNIATASIDVSRAQVDCNAKLNITSDGPITVTLAGCSRTVQAG